MPSLADIELIDLGWLDTICASTLCAEFLWHGLDAGTRATYQSSQKSWEFYCAQVNVPAYPASLQQLGEWVSARASGAPITGSTNRIKADTILMYLAAIRSVHTDRCINDSVFDSPWLKRIVAGIRRLQVHVKRQANPITIAQLDRMTTSATPTINDLNFEAAAKTAFAGFLRAGEFTYTEKDLKRNSFSKTKPTRSDVTFSDDNRYAILRLKRSKTDRKHRGVDIYLAATSNSRCPVAALQRLFRDDPQPPGAPLFRTSTGAFTREHLLTTMKMKLPGIDTSGHSFRRGAAQFAHNNGISDHDIQTLGRWTSAAFQLYFNTARSQLYALNYRFQTQRSPSLTA